MNITRRGFLRRIIGTAALVAVPSLGVAKAKAETGSNEFTYTEGKMEFEYGLDAAQELENILAKELVDEMDKEFLRIVRNA